MPAWHWCLYLPNDTDSSMMTQMPMVIRHAAPMFVMTWKHSSASAHKASYQTALREAGSSSPHTFWMLATEWVPEMRAAARPKKVLAPVAYTTHGCSPCLMVEPLKATCPGNFLTGSDSPVRAAWSTCKPTAARPPQQGSVTYTLASLY